MNALTRIALICALVFLSAIGRAQPSSAALEAAAENYLAKKPVSGLEEGFSMDEGLKAQKIFVQALSKKMGPVAGYKIGLITKPNQERMGAKGPVSGTLLKGMLLKTGSKVAADYGIKPAAELDMGVFVKDAAINDAKTVDEFASYLSDLVCFIELVDTITATNQPMDASLLVALNVGARAGIIGERRSFSKAGLAEALPEMRMVMTDESGTVLGEVPILNLQPLENIALLIEALKKQGTALKRGDFISLGSPAAPIPIPAGKTVTLRYENLPGGPLTAKVSFPPLPPLPRN
jgi:2-keto-4-pentenoate hydratase